jgi:uncharacterized membrane protein
MTQLSFLMCIAVTVYLAGCFLLRISENSMPGYFKLEETIKRNVSEKLA